MNIYDEIEKEREHQNLLWGIDSDDKYNTPWLWVSYIARWSTKWMDIFHSFEEKDANRFRECMIQTASLCVAAVESLDRQRKNNGKAFYETKK